MFMTQKKYFMPMPDYDLSDDEVKVTVPGKIINENYARLLMDNVDLPLDSVCLLDRVQKGIRIEKSAADKLREKGLASGRYPHLYPSAKIAAVTNDKARFTKTKSVDDKFLKQLIIEYLKQWGRQHGKTWTMCCAGSSKRD